MGMADWPAADIERVQPTVRTRREFELPGEDAQGRYAIATDNERGFSRIEGLVIENRLR
jgi:hypothetical protein